MKKIIVIAGCMVALVFASICICRAQVYETITKDNEVSDVKDVILKVTIEKEANTSLRELYKEMAGILAYEQEDQARIDADKARVTESIEAALLQANKIVLSDPNAKAEEIIK